MSVYASTLIVKKQKTCLTTRPGTAPGSCTPENAPGRRGPIPDEERRGHTCTAANAVRCTCGGGTAVLGDGVRVFRHFMWLEAGSVKMALPRPACQHSRVCFATLITLIGRYAGLLTRRGPRDHLAGRAASRWARSSHCSNGFEEVITQIINDTRTESLGTHA
jgi:hypothetical protein